MVGCFYINSSKNLKALRKCHFIPDCKAIPSYGLSVCLTSKCWLTFAFMLGICFAIRLKDVRGFLFHILTLYIRRNTTELPDQNENNCIYPNACHFKAAIKSRFLDIFSNYVNQ